MKDVAIRNNMANEYPGVFLELSYEEMAANPIKSAETLYQFTFSKSLTDNTKKWLLSKTQKKDAKVGLHNVERSNSTATSLAWKTELSPEAVNSIEANCSKLISYLQM